jgi:hypothetical protein
VKITGRVAQSGWPAMPRAAAQHLQVFEKAFDDEQKGQADDGQVVAPGLERRDGDDQGADEAAIKPRK